MSDLSAAAAALGVPEAIAQRSAEARAAATGVSVEEILAAWAGGSEAPAPTQAAPEPAPAEAPTDSAPEETEPEAPAAPAQPEEVQPAPAGAVSRAPVPAEVSAAEAANLPVVVTVPTTGLKERTNFAVPKWLALIFLVVPVFALFALGGSAPGECGVATELAVDVVTGEVVNCDGSEFTGSAVGGGGTDFIALGEAIYQGGEVPGVSCAGCHGATGGGGAGPPLNGVLTVFGSCADHHDWVELGTGGFQARGDTTYGDTDKPLGGFGAPMPGFGGSLTAEQISAVAAFERVRFGGQSPDEALTDCGLVEDAGGEEGGEDGASDDGATEDGATDEGSSDEGTTDGGTTDEGGAGGGETGETGDA